MHYLRQLQLVSTIIILTTKNMSIHNRNQRTTKKDMCVATRVATGFRAGCHHAKGKCGIKQKTKIKKTLNITLHQSLIQKH